MTDYDSAYAARDALDIFIYARWPVAMKLFGPLFTLRSCRAAVTVYAIENSIGMNPAPDDKFVFVEKDGRMLQGDASRLADTSVGQELTWLESIADKVAAGHDSFYSAFSVDLMRCTAKLLDKEYTIPSRHVKYISDADAIIKLRNEYLAIIAAMRLILPQTLARELAAAASDNYI